MTWSFDEVFLARHGRTEWNPVRRRQGQLDSPLTAAGRDDADRIAAALATGMIDGIFSSPQGRARSTAERVGASVGCGVNVIKDLAELHHGRFAGLTNDEIEAAHPGELARRAIGKFTWRFPGGESYEDADTRAGSALTEIARAGAHRPLIVTHEMIALMLLRQLLGLDPDDALGLGLAHGVIVRIDLRGPVPWRGTL